VCESPCYRASAWSCTNNDEVVNRGSRVSKTTHDDRVTIGSGIWCLLDCKDVESKIAVEELVLIYLRDNHCG
jgi:hypothetical protein